MIVAYIAGPYSPSNGRTIEQNVAAAVEVGREIANLGIVPLIPHVIGAAVTDSGRVGIQTDEWWYDATMRLMRRCDILVLMPGWGASKGSVAEHRGWLRTHGVHTVFDLVHDFERERLKEWIK